MAGVRGGPARSSGAFAPTALDAAERIGAPALLEQVSTLRELAALRDGQAREPEARPFIELALALATEHELGGRVLFELTAL